MLYFRNCRSASRNSLTKQRIERNILAETVSVDGAALRDPLKRAVNAADRIILNKIAST